MTSKRLLPLAALAILSLAPAAQSQQNQDQKVIDDFVTTRGVSFDDSAHKPAPQRQAGRATPARRNNSASGSKNSGSGAAGGVASHKPSTPNATKTGGAQSDGEVVAQSDASTDTGAGAQTLKASASVGPLRPIGLGYTIFMKDKSGGLLPVDAAQEFHSGDRIAVALEPNTEGYIYVFEAENDRDPVMLFPNVVLDGGANAARAHVRETYPADVNYAFEFDQTPAVEHLYVVVSRHPLADVPTAEALGAFCGKKRDDCYWKPTAEQWRRIKAGATDRRVTEAKNTQLAQLQKQPLPPTSLQRGIKVKRDEPAPAIVRVNDSPDADSLVTVIKLVHK